MTATSDITCYPGMGCDQGDCATNARCYTGRRTQDDHVAGLLTDDQCARLGITPAAAAAAAEWARNYGRLTDDQRDRLRTVLNPYVQGG